MNGIGSIASTILKGEAPFSINTGGEGLAGHTVSTNSTAGDIARAAAMSYHDVELDMSEGMLTRKWTRRQRKFKSKFAKNTDDASDAEDPDIDEATREESASNHPAHKRNLNEHIAKRAQTYTQLPKHMGGV